MHDLDVSTFFLVSIPSHFDLHDPSFNLLFMVQILRHDACDHFCSWTNVRLNIALLGIVANNVAACVNVASSNVRIDMRIGMHAKMRKAEVPLSQDSAAPA